MIAFKFIKNDFAKAQCFYLIKKIIKSDNNDKRNKNFEFNVFFSIVQSKIRRFDQFNVQKKNQMINYLNKQIIVAIVEFETQFFIMSQ